MNVTYIDYIACTRALGGNQPPELGELLDAEEEEEALAAGRLRRHLDSLRAFCFLLMGSLPLCLLLWHFLLLPRGPQSAFSMQQTFAFRLQGHSPWPRARTAGRLSGTAAPRLLTGRLEAVAHGLTFQLLSLLKFRWLRAGFLHRILGLLGSRLQSNKLLFSRLFSLLSSLQSLQTRATRLLNDTSRSPYLRLV